MRSARFLLATAVMAFAGFAMTPAQAATLITDGNFDTPLSAGTFTTYSASSSFGTGNAWTVANGSVDEIGSYWQAPPTGGGSVDLAGNSAGAIQQSFNAASGSYNLQFYLSGNPDGGPATKEVTVTIGSTSANFFYTIGGNSKGSMNYILENLAFTSACGSNLLTFQSDDKDSPFGAVIGGVSVSAVPEPATWMMLLLGFGGIGWMLRASRRQTASLA